MDDCFLIREFLRPHMHSDLAVELVRVVRSRPLASTAVRSDRYAVGYSAALTMTSIGRQRFGVALPAVARLMNTELTVTISEEQITRMFLTILVPPFLACMSPADICAKAATASSNPTAGTPRLRSNLAVWSRRLVPQKVVSGAALPCNSPDPAGLRYSTGGCESP